jgi:hypothetical protein
MSREKMLVLPFMIVAAPGFAAYDMRMDILDGNHIAVAKLCILLAAYFICHGVNLAIWYWYLDRHGNVPLLRHCCIDAAILAAPLAIAVLAPIQREFPSAIVTIIIAGTLISALTVVMVNVARKSIS